jgi:hypothetical protein
MPSDLPAQGNGKAADVPMATRESLRTIAQKLSNTITKYVLFICREGTMNTIEKQTNLLLEDLRKMVTALRSVYPVASPLQRKCLSRVGVRVLGNIRELVQDIGKQVVYQIETQHDPDSDPNSFENNNHLSRLTARVWNACEGITRAPLTPMEATSAEMAMLSELIADAAREVGELKQGSHEEPRVDDGDSDEDEDEDEDTDDGAAAADKDTDVLATGAYDADDEAAIRRELAALHAEEQDGVEDYRERALAKSEYRWVPGALALTRAAADIMARAGELIGKIEPPAELARGFGGEGSAAEAPLNDPAWAARVADSKASLDAQLEQRLADCEYVSSKCDELVQALGTPQSLVKAARCSYIITTRCAKVLAWLETLSQQGWLAAAHAASAKNKKKQQKAKAAKAAASSEGAAAADPEAPAAAAAAATAAAVAAAAAAETAEAAPATSAVTEAPAAAAVAAGARVPWYEDGAVIPAIADWERASRARALALVQVERATEEQWPADQIPSVPEAPGARPVTVVGSWGFLDAARQQLAAAYAKEPSLYRQHIVYKGGDEAVDNSDDEEDSDGEAWQYDEDEDEDDDEDEDGFDDFD